MNRKPSRSDWLAYAQVVTTDPEVMRETPVFKGTWIPVDLVADMLTKGATAKEILEGYPMLNEEMLSLAPLCVRMFSILK